MTTDMLVELAAALRVWFTVTMGLTGARSLYRENTHIDPHLVGLVSLVCFNIHLGLKFLLCSRNDSERFLNSCAHTHRSIAVLLLKKLSIQVKVDPTIVT